MNITKKTILITSGPAAIETMDLSSKGKSNSDLAKFKNEMNYVSVISSIENFLPSLETSAEAVMISTVSVVAMAPVAIIPTYSATKDFGPTHCHSDQI